MAEEFGITAIVIVKAEEHWLGAIASDGNITIELRGEDLEKPLLTFPESLLDDLLAQLLEIKDSQP